MLSFSYAGLLGTLLGLALGVAWDRRYPVPRMWWPAKVLRPVHFEALEALVQVRVVRRKRHVLVKHARRGLARWCYVEEQGLRWDYDHEVIWWATKIIPTGEAMPIWMAGNPYAPEPSVYWRDGGGYQAAEHRPWG